MSKIYEALLRAEIDRIASQNGQNQPVQDQSVPDQSTPDQSTPDQSTPDRSTSAPDQPTPEQQPDPLRVEAPTPIRQERTQRVASSASAARRSESLPAAPPITEHPWNLSRKQLPSLEERGSAVEQFRSLRSRMREFRDLGTLKSILVSSGLPKEGKSFIAANLAISLARHRSSNVLLIDGDMRRGTQHHLLGAPSEPGLTEYLSGIATLGQVLQRAAPSAAHLPLPPGIASLHFIPAGADAENAADLSGNQRFGILMESVYKLYDWIIVDSSPVNLVTDGVNLARNCDGVLLVTRGAVTKFQTAQRALTELKASKVIGVVLNAVENPPTSEGYYGYGEYDKLST